MFEYKEGYLEKVVAKTPLSEDLVTLRMDSIRHLVQLDVPTTSQEEAKDPAEFQEENDEQGWYLGTNLWIMLFSYLYSTRQKLDLLSILPSTPVQILFIYIVIEIFVEL